MSEKKIKEEGENNPKLSSYEKAKFILIIVLVVSLGFLFLNQFLSFKYKMVFVQKPCELCKELNPHLDKCFEEASTIYIDKNTREELTKEEVEEVKKEYYKSYYESLNLSPLIHEP